MSFALVLGLVLLLLSLVDYQDGQVFFFSDGLFSPLVRTSPLTASNTMGELGATCAVILFNLAGLGAFFVPLCLGLVAWRTLMRPGTLFPWLVGRMVVAFLAVVTLFSRVAPGYNEPTNAITIFGMGDFVPNGVGGALGNFLYREIAGVVLGNTGTLVIFSLIYAYCLLGLVVLHPHRRVAEWVQQVPLVFAKFFISPKPRFIPDVPPSGSVVLSAELAEADATPGNVAVDEPPLAAPEPDSLDAPDIGFLAQPFTPLDPAERELTDDDGVLIDRDEYLVLDEVAAGTANEEAREAKLSRARTSKRGNAALTIIGEETMERATDVLTPKQKGAYQFPPSALLKEPPPPEEGPQENYEERAAKLVNTLGEFKLKVDLGEVQTGPVITRYEVIPAPGVRVEKITNLANNIAMNLKAESVRVLAPVPGKGTVGIEVPNGKPKAVALREIIESRAWVDNKCEIPIVLGKDVTGRPIIADLARMPHCLIAGSTGSGKSVCINGVVASLVYHAGPEDIRFIMVDPKVVELQVYNKLPHMLIPVVTDPKKVPGALKWLISEMERRYQIFAKTKVRNIAGFNAKLSKDRAEAELARLMDMELSAEERAATAQPEVPRDDGVLEIPDKKLPYIVCFIDELADLMMVAPADIETAIARLAQLARAAGIHLILATQRPSVNVITGIIKANLPCRIAFKVTSFIDSRTILDQKGAEALIGRGDMLFIPPGSAHLVRAQGAFVSEEEIAALVEHVSLCNGEPEFADDVQEIIEKAAFEASEDDGGATEGTDDPSEDPMLAKSWEIIRTTKKASTSFLQRKLAIGYGRAAKIIDALEERGYIGPDLGPGNPREILRE
ncbi:MAG: DNA translocase FtsK [Puniceicoccales bacterium]|jgi:S-DNA-T family DNA segregation ATPase FtsK/SpoIIIE|nr:DNA translocase FtsK [Puniceicoccales bacterium]